MSNHETALRIALLALEIKPIDTAVEQLALTYARALDGGTPIEKLGPQYLACLDALGLTPKARTAVAKGNVGEPPATISPLARLRAQHANRTNGSGLAQGDGTHGTTPVDATPA